MHVKSCKICGKRAARYVCQECSRTVCEICLKPNTWFRSDCYSRLKGAAPTLEYTRSATLFKLFLVGFFLILVGVIFVMIAAVLFGDTASFGGIILVGPIPIIFGAGPNYFWAIILALFLTILGIVIFILMRKKV